MTKLLPQITRPTLIIQEKIIRRNIEQMIAKITASQVFRPHFKTHQNHQIGRIFREFAVSKISVSSLEMAEFFAQDGWSDIMLAIPANLRQVDLIHSLAKRVKLSLIVDSLFSAQALLAELSDVEVDLWLEIDTGQKRTGFWFENVSEISQCVNFIRKNSREKIKLRGLVNHAGHSYSCRGADEVEKFFAENLQKLSSLKTAITQEDWQPLISFGDTPCCSVVQSFAGIDEIRAGNFVYFDTSQEQIGSCAAQDIAVAVAAPIISIHPERNEAVIYGGAVHFSKENLTDERGANYGYLVGFEKSGEWKIFSKENRLVRISQEHGVLHLQDEILKNLRIGEVVFVQPVHSCLTADLLKNDFLIL